METSKNSTNFIPSATFKGRKEGYVFKNGDSGVGYYFDRLNPYLALAAKKAVASLSTSTISQDVGKKRKVMDGFYDDDPEPLSKRKDPPSAALENEEVGVSVEQLDSSSLKQLLLSFEKKITKNQKMRMKYVDEPEKFMESEFELHKEIEDLHVVAASPELYPILVQTNTISSILGMITHENTDISIAAISLLQELTDVDTITEQPDHTLPLLEALANEPPGLELLVQNLFRLDESNNEDAQGVYNTFAILENIVEIKSTLADALCERTPILKFLLQRLKTKVFDDNKLYASEILSILLQTSSDNCKRLSQLQDIDGMDTLLQCLAIYRRRHVERSDEQECCENLFLCLNSVLMVPENQEKFLACEGFELLMKCLEEQEYAAGCTIKSLSYAVMKNRSCCERFIQVGGLKYSFALLVGKGLKKALRKKGSGEKRNVEESALAIVAQLCTQMFHGTEQDNNLRLAAKFVENDHEKLRACVEFYANARDTLAKTDADLNRTRQILIQQGDEEALEEFEDEDNLLVQRLDGGLFTMHQLSLMLMFAVLMDRSCLQVLIQMLDKHSLDVAEILEVVRDMILTLKQDISDEEDASSENHDNSSVSREKAENLRYLQLLTSWTAAFAQRLDDELSAAT